MAASADLFRQSYRTAVVVSGYLWGIFLLFYFTSDSIPTRELIFTLVAMATVLFLFLKIEIFWTEEAESRIKSERETAVLEYKQIELSKNAHIGTQVKTIAHELNNLIFLIDLSIEKKDNADFEKIKRAVEAIKKVNRLVLVDFNNKTKKTVESFDVVVSNIKLLLEGDIVLSGVSLNVDISPEARDFKFSETSGSLFLILCWISPSLSHPISPSLSHPLSPGLNHLIS